MVAKEKMRLDFSARLNLACDEAGVRVHGRAVDIESTLKRYSIKATTTAIGKWLNGDAIPSAEKLRVLAEWLDVRPEWLEYGIEPQRHAGKIIEEARQVQQASASLEAAEQPKHDDATASVDPACIATTPEEQLLLADFRVASPEARRQARAVLLEVNTRITAAAAPKSQVNGGQEVDLDLLQTILDGQSEIREDFKAILAEIRAAKEPAAEARKTQNE